MKDFIPDETLITSASQVENKFPKKKRTGDDSDSDFDEDESDGDLPIEEDELPWAKEIKK